MGFRRSLVRIQSPRLTFPSESPCRPGPIGFMALGGLEPPGPASVTVAGSFISRRLVSPSYRVTGVGCDPNVTTLLSLFGTRFCGADYPYGDYGLELLEDRLAPATFGTPWPDPQHLTLSFAPDGTKGGTSTSTLFQMLNAKAATATWQVEVLRAFQTWAMNGNINIAVAADGGQAL